MFKSKSHYTFLWVALTLIIGLLLIGPSPAEAGIFNANNQVTYKEYWVNHKQFTGGCGTDLDPDGSWYVEPWTLDKCPKTLSFTLPDDFSNAARVEIYLDLWRAYNIKALSFKLNDGPTTYKVPVGSDWSRTPWVAEIDKSELIQGTNTINFWAERPTHIHDIAIRIYYNNDNPLLPGPGSDVEPPNGQLTSIQDDGAPVTPDQGGTLTVNNNQLKLTADVSADTAYVEFHAWYEGYDEDNDGVFRDWHNLGRNNWWPGGQNTQPTGGTINHIGSVATGGATTASVTWNIAHITNQAQIRFKIRVVDEAGNVREAAGGPSANFKLMRSAPVNAFTIHDFVDFGLHMDGKRPDVANYDIVMPSSVSSVFTNAYLIGAYWKNPFFSINGSPNQLVNSPDWALGIKSFNKGYLVPGLNRVTYSWVGSGSGHFVESPGPMFVLRRNTAAADNTPPVVSRQNPAPNATNVSVKLPVIAHVGDEVFGVDWTSVIVTINDVNVTNGTKIAGVMGDYRLIYNPPGDLDYSTEYNVKIEACDLVGNCMNPVTYKFTTAPKDTNPPNIANVVVTPLPFGANITWTTNEPATSRVDYGETAGYGDTVEDITLVTSHTLQVRDLQPETTYHFRIRSTDEQGNTGQTPDDTFTTTKFKGIQSDDFNVCSLSPYWSEVDPKGDVAVEFPGEVMKMTIPAGSPHDFSTAGGPPRIRQLASDSDFLVEVKFESLLTASGQLQGILIEESNNTYVRAAFEQSPTGPILFVRFVKDGVTLKNATKAFAADAVPSQLRIGRTGNTFSWFYYEGGAWRKPLTWQYDMPMAPLYVGVFAGSSGAPGAAPGHVAIVDYFFNSNDPIAQEDNPPLGVNVDIVGQGSVVKVPDRSKYVCGEEVVLSATPDPGWSFDNWSGDAAGEAPTTLVTINGVMDVTATFTQDQYTLNIVYNNIGGGGAGNTVTKNPNKPTYVYDEVVQLTATPQAGWRFVSWSGGLTGTNPVASITMRKSESVTATFRENLPPTIEPLADKTTQINQKLTVQVSATEPDGEPLTLWAKDVPLGGVFKDNGGGQGTFTWQPGVLQAGTYTVTFIASDGAARDEESIQIVVTGVGITLPLIVKP